MTSGKPDRSRSVDQQARWPLATGAAVYALAAAVAIAALRSQPVDLDVYRSGGQAVLDGRPLYPGPLATGLNFTYPPLAALLFVPLAVGPAAVVQAGVCAANLALLAFVCGRSLTALGEAPGRRLIATALLAAGALFWLDPVRTTVYLGQVNLALLAVVLWDMLSPDTRRTKGVGVGIAAGIKLSPLIFVLFLLLTRRYRAAATASATFAGTVAIGFLVVPGDAARYWLGGLFTDTSRIFSDPASSHNQSMYGLLARTVDAATSRPLWLALTVLAVIATLALAVGIDRRGGNLLAVTLVGLASSAVSPFSWNHHWVWLMPLTVFIGRQLTLKPTWKGLTPWLVPAILLPLTLPWIANLANPPVGSPTLTEGPAAFLLGNVYVVIYLAVLVAATVLTRDARLGNH